MPRIAPGNPGVPSNNRESQTMSIDLTVDGEVEVVAGAQRLCEAGGNDRQQTDGDEKRAVTIAATGTVSGESSSASLCADFLEEGVQRPGFPRRGHRGAGAIALANSDEAIERPDGGDGGALERRGKDDELFPVL